MTEIRYTFPMDIIYESNYASDRSVGFVDKDIYY